MLIAASLASLSGAQSVAAQRIDQATGGPLKITSLIAKRVAFDPTLRHNVDDIAVIAGGQSYVADFLAFYNQTGGLDRWGYPTSEVFQEEPGNLVQYYQRGVIDWHWRADMGIYVLERRLAWDYFGGDRAGSGQVQGVEPGPSGSNGAVGPWGHTVSDTAVDGTQTGFLQFFLKYGGVASFGYPKTEARQDTGAGLHIPAATNGFMRQYFQAAVFEFHPDTPNAPVELRLLGDDLRDSLYPNASWKQINAFGPAIAETRGQFLGLESRVGTSLLPPDLSIGLAPQAVQQGRSVEIHVSAPANQSVFAQLDGDDAFALAPFAGGYWGIVGIDPWAEAGVHTVSATLQQPDGSRVPLAQGAITVLKTDFPWVEDLPLPPSKGDITQKSVQRAENLLLKPTFDAYTPTKLWAGVFLRPVSGPVTGQFGTNYSNDGGKTFHNYHEGLDIGVPTGTPILAAANGNVVVARPLHVRGNGVILDHGMGVLSGYYHMSQIVAVEGSQVHRGDLIGYSGETGFATGPHLHWELRVHNQFVDPAEWTVRDFAP